jgi:hypothetical protein
MRLKRCAGRCKQRKPISEFNKNRVKVDGLGTSCRKCSNENSRQYYRENGEQHIKYVAERRKRVEAENRLNIIAYLLKHPCVDCGEADIMVLDFDHVRGKKRLAVSLMVYSDCRWNTIFTEIKKCDVRCANCHRRRTAKQFKSYRFIYTHKKSAHA